MAYNDAIMNSADKQKIAALGEQWQAAQKAGNQGGMNEAHEQAELIRKKYGYSGGGDGSGFKIVGNNTVLPEAKDQSESINKIYDAQQKVKTDALKAAYDQNMADYDAQAAKIPQTYNEARRQVSTQADISRANLNEQMAGSGINVGAGSQLALSQQNSRNAAMGKVSSAEADALSDLEAQRQKVKTAYQNAVAQAISENDAARAKALYAEAQRVDNSIVNTAVKQLSVDTTLVPNVVSGVAQGVDGTVRDTYNGDTVWENNLNAMKSKIPGLRETLPAALDNWGQEKKYTGTAAENFLNATLNPGSVTKYRTSAVNQELYRLESMNIDVKYPEKKAPLDGSRNGKDVDLTQDEKRQYQRAYGQTAYDNIQKVIQSSVYKQSSDAEKAAAIQNLLEVATAAGKKKAKLDGGDAPSWTTKSDGSVADNAVYRAKLGTALDTLPANARDRNGDVMLAIIKTVVGKRGGSDQLALNVMAQQLEEGTQAKVETAYNGGYELKQIVDFYQKKYAKKPGTSQKKYKKEDLYAWAMQNGYTAKQFNQLWKLFS